jgi:endonuclease G
MSSKKFIGLIFTTLLMPVQAETITLEYNSWSIEYNCENRGYQYFHYLTVPDGGSIERVSRFTKEMRLPKKCRQFKTSSYKLPKGAPISYDRGHGVHQNIWDNNKDLMKESNMMSNIVPQASKLNRSGVWRKAEELTECYRDLGQVEVWGGVIWGDDESNDHFVESHGVTTPDYLWKVIKFPDGEVNAWLMPNNNLPKSAVMDAYLVSPYKIENLTNKVFDINYNQKNEIDSYSVKRPKGCSLK